MEYGICNLSIVPLRKEAADSSEMISQVLFGETLEVQIKQSPWVKVKLCYDGYEGWMDEKQFLWLDKEQFDKVASHHTSVALEIVQSAVSPKRQLPILIGSSLPGFDGMNFKLNKEKFVYNGQAISPDNHDDLHRLVEKVALKYLDSPYLWGGRGPFGIDCSGFTQQVFKIMGIPIKRDAYQQAESGTLIPFAEKAQEGDLAFFEKEGKIHHVGIVLKEGRVIHASGRVRIDKFDHYGIHNLETKKYTHKLKFIKRIL